MRCIRFLQRLPEAGRVVRRRQYFRHSDARVARAALHPSESIAVAVVLATLVIGSGPPTIAPGSGEFRPASSSPLRRITGEPRGPDPAIDRPEPLGSTIRASVSTEEQQASGDSIDASISPDGRYVAFASAAFDLVARDTNRSPDIFVRDLQRGTTRRISLLGGSQLPAGSNAGEPSISRGGRFVAWTYTPPRVAGITGAVLAPRSRVILTETATEKSQFVSTNPRGAPVGPSFQPSISPDGDWVAFTSSASSIVEGDRNEAADIFLWNRTSRKSVRVSVDSAGREALGPSETPSVSDGGRLVAFASDASRLAPDDENPGKDVFIHDLETGATTLMTPMPPPVPGLAAPIPQSRTPAISADGRFVAFESTASLVPSDANGVDDVYVRDIGSGSLSLVSIALGGAAGRGASGDPAISDDGRFVAFKSVASDLVPAPVTARFDVTLAAVATSRSQVFVRDLAIAETIEASAGAGVTGTTTGSSGRPSITGRGDGVAFDSTATDLIRGDTNERSDVFVRRLPPIVTIDPDAVDFGSQLMNVPGMPRAVTVANHGWGGLDINAVAIAGRDATDFSVVFDGCRARRLYAGDACTVTVLFTARRQSSRGVLRVVDTGPGSPRQVTLVGRGSTATLTVNPALGPPGIVVAVAGKGFPSGARLTLAWKPGFNQPLGEIVADANGSFVVRVLVYRNDALGRRDMRAVSVGGPAFDDVAVPFLVVPGRGQPPGFSAYGSHFRPESIILRR
jgi:Tol biopolymer transport system component